MSEVRALLFNTFGTPVDRRAGLITQLEQGLAHLAIAQLLWSLIYAIN